MKKHQVALVGGQRLPIYLGVLERKPDVVHLVYTEASAGVAQLLERCLLPMVVELVRVEAYDFFQIQRVCEQILASDEEGVWELNATGGTKIMSLAAISIFSRNSHGVIYIDQNNDLLEVDKGRKNPIAASLTIADFFTLADQSSHTSEKLSDFTVDEFRLAQHILTHRISAFAQLSRKFWTFFSDANSIPSFGRYTHEPQTYIDWDNAAGKVELCIRSKPKISVRTNKGIDIAMIGGWWEIVVAQTISNWPMVKELLMNVVLPFKSEANPKNEIDVLVNLGHQLIFVECKAGEVKMHDINKLKVVRDNYGGLGAKAVLVCYKKPENRVVERCKEAGIEVYSYELEGGSFSGLIPLLEAVSHSRSI